MLEKCCVTYICRYKKGKTLKTKRIEYILEGNLENPLGMNFFSPFQPEREFKVQIMFKSCKCSQIICSRVHNTVCSLDYPFQLRIS